MKTLKNFCLYCVSLRTGCIIVGCLEVVPWVMLIVYDLNVMSWMKPEPNEDEENIHQRNVVRFIYIFHMIRCLALIFFAAFIIVSTVLSNALFLKIATVLEVVLFVVHALISVVAPQHAIVGRFFLCWILLSVWRLFSAAVLYSYCRKLEQDLRRATAAQAAQQQEQESTEQLSASPSTAAV